MANKTVKKIVLKLREDHVWDLYIDDQWVLSRGNHETLLEELKKIMDWSTKHVWSTLHICWGAQAGLYHHFGIPKYDLPQKMLQISV